MGLLPCNVFYNLVPPWADNYVTMWTWGGDAPCAAGRRSRVLYFLFLSLSLRPCLEGRLVVRMIRVSPSTDLAVLL